MATSSEESPREYWPDWAARNAPEVRLLTRDELLAELRHHNVRPIVTQTALRYWEYRGILPRPRRQKHGAVVAAVYPIWVVTVIRAMRGFEAAGIALADLRPYLRAEADRASNPPPGNRLHTVGLAPEPYVQQYFPVPGDWLSRLDGAQRGEVAYAIDHLIASIVRPEEFPTNNPYAVPEESLAPPAPAPFVRARLHLTDAQGRETVIDLPMDDPDQWTSE